jgi:hypothetical protein
MAYSENDRGVRGAGVWGARCGVGGGLSRLYSRYIYMQAPTRSLASPRHNPRALNTGHRESRETSIRRQVVAITNNRGWSDVFRRPPPRGGDWGRRGGGAQGA